MHSRKMQSTKCIATLADIVLMTVIKKKEKKINILHATIHFARKSGKQTTEKSLRARENYDVACLCIYSIPWWIFATTLIFACTFVEIINTLEGFAQIYFPFLNFFFAFSCAKLMMNFTVSRKNFFLENKIEWTSAWICVSFNSNNDYL